MADTPKQGLASIGIDIKIGKTALNYATKLHASRISQRKVFQVCRRTIAGR